MNLDDQLAELLAGLGVVLEDATSTESALALDLDDPSPEDPDDSLDEQFACGDDVQPSELCLFQTSREHYGVFYRLDLIAGAPHLRIFLPDESGEMKMRCYLVRTTAASPLSNWFGATHRHAGSTAFDDARETAHQHLLFAAGEVMKRLFWSSELDHPSFPPEIEVRRLA